MVFACLSTVCAVVTLGFHIYLIMNNLSCLEHAALKKGNPFSHRTPVSSPDLLSRLFIFVRSNILRKAKDPSAFQTVGTDYWRNFTDVMGTDLWYWAVPVKPRGSHADGYSWGLFTL